MAQVKLAWVMMAQMEKYRVKIVHFRYWGGGGLEFRGWGFTLRFQFGDRV